METEKKYLRIIDYVIHRNWYSLKAYGIDKDEAYSAGLVGLTLTIKNHKSVNDASFFCDAYQAIWGHIFSGGRLGILHSQKKIKILWIRRLKQTIFNRTGKHLSDEQIAVMIGSTTEVLRDVQRTTSNFSAFIGVGDDGIIGEMSGELFEDEKALLPEENLNKKMLLETVLREVNKLPTNQRRVLKLYFGIGVKNNFSVRRIKELLHTKPGEATTLLKEALEMLTQNPRLRALGETEGLFVRECQADFSLHRLRRIITGQKCVAIREIAEL